MKLLKPTWVHHDDKPIFSVDVHQECLKFATGGQGLDSGRVVIWNLLPVLSEKAELDDSVPKMLCQMDNHLACVNCVRWSQNGQMLASGSDDKLVMIWRKSKGSSGVFGTGGIQKNPESWKCSATLRGHSGDVLDLAWSPQDSWLASCSIDNTIIVWDVHTLPNMVAMLKGHTGLVKGVAWDPVGKFLASQSDDRSVKIWKTSDWTCSNTITEPFEECGGTTHILRLSWSPDGQYLVSAHAMNGGGPTAQIIEREGWKCDKDFVGHRKAVTCVRFHNAILKRQAAKSNKPQQYCCLAVGSRDRSLSVWMTALQRPLVVVHELFNDSILDLSWGPDKCILMACSGDGTVACLQFSESELGAPLSVEEKNSLYQRIYGKSVTMENGTADTLIENPELLNSSQEKMRAPTLPTITMSNQNNNSFVESVSSLPVAYGMTSHQPVQDNNPITAASVAINKQMETRTADGKRRITPVFIPLNQDVSNTTMPQLNSSSRSMTKCSAPDIPKTSDNGEVNDHLPKARITEEDQTLLDNRLVKCSTNATAIVQPDEVNRDALGTFPNIITGNSATAALTSATGAVSTSFGPRLINSIAYQASTTGPKLNITANTKCEFQKSALDYRVHVHNGNVQTASGMLTKVTAFALSLGEKLWEVYIGSPIVNFNFSLKYVMLCSLDGTMRLLNMQTGVQTLPVICLTTAAIQCAFCPLGKLVGVITECGILRIWNVERQCVTLTTTCTEIFGKFGAVIQFHITELGVPLVLFANGNSYTYSQQMQSWLVLSTKDPILRHGLQTTLPKEFQKNFRMYPLTTVQAATHSFTANCAMDLNSNDWQSAAKITFIENQIKLAEAVNSPEELKHWYTMLAYHLALTDNEKRLRLLLNDLMGSGHGPLSQRNRKILSIPKHTLLQCVLSALKPHVKWQRIYMEYNELFENLQTAPNAVNGPSADGDIKRNVLDNENTNNISMDTT